jgi:hypothetical protein
LWNTNPSSLGRPIGGTPGNPASLANRALDAPVQGLLHLGGYDSRPTAMSWQSPETTAPLLAPQTAQSNGLSNWAQAPTGNPFSGFPADDREAPDGRPASFAGVPQQPKPVAQNLTVHALRMKGVTDADIAAAIGNPKLMQQIINQSYGRGSAGDPAKIEHVPYGTGASNGPYGYSEPPSEDARVHLAQVFAFPPVFASPPVSIFARPPVYIPRQLTPLEDLPSGSAGGQNAGKPFSQWQNSQAPKDAPCIYCGRATNRNTSPDPERYNGDHIIPRKQGGNSDPENLGYACQACNLGKGGRTPKQWYDSIKRWITDDGNISKDSL